MSTIEHRSYLLISKVMAFYLKSWFKSAAYQLMWLFESGCFWLLPILGLNPESLTTLIQCSGFREYHYLCVIKAKSWIWINAARHRKQTFRSLLVSYPKKDWQAGAPSLCMTATIIYKILLFSALSRSDGARRFLQLLMSNAPSTFLRFYVFHVYQHSKCSHFRLLLSSVRCLL